MTPVDDQLRELLHERAVPPAAPPGRADVVLRAARTRRRRQVLTAGAAAALAVAAAITVPFGLSTREEAPPAAPAALYPPGSEPLEVSAVVAARREIVFTLLRGACQSPASGAAQLRDGRWHLAAWRAGGSSSGSGPCAASAHSDTVRVPLSEPYAGQPVVEARTGREIPVNGGPGFPVPTYLPPGYSLAPAGGDGADPGRTELVLTGPQGDILLMVGGREIGTVADQPGWPYDVLDRPDIDGARGLLIRYRNDRDNTLLRWLDGDRGISLQVFPEGLDPQELVRVARSMR